MDHVLTTVNVVRGVIDPHYSVFVNSVMLEENCLPVPGGGRIDQLMEGKESFDAWQEMLLQFGDETLWPLQCCAKP